MIDVAEELAKKYYEDDTFNTIESVRKMLAIPGVYFYLSPQNVLWVYILISDEGLTLLKSATKESDFTQEFSDQLLKHPGHHIYIFRSLAPYNEQQRQAFRTAANYILKRHNAEDIWWHDETQVKLHTYKREHNV